jgi:hypothetical protein
VDNELRVYFPDMFGEGSTFDLFHRLLQRARLQLEEIIKDTDLQKKLKEIDSWLLEQHTPQNFDADERGSFLVQSKSSFAKICAGLRDSGIHAPESLTTMQFYTQIQHIKNKANAISANNDPYLSK